MNDDEDLIRVRHMLDFSHEVMSMTTGHNRETLDEDRIYFRALTYCVGIIGEAASKLSLEFRTRADDIAWKRIIGMRNFLFHEYFAVDKDVLWDTAIMSVPQLIAPLEALLSRPDES